MSVISQYIRGVAAAKEAAKKEIRARALEEVYQFPTPLEKSVSPTTTYQFPTPLEKSASPTTVYTTTVT